jgi:outer membrane protein assembly factor BamD (BamD/ComL family)
LLELANLHVKREEYDRALGIFQSLLGRTRGTPLGEEANYGIVTTYMAMMKPKAGSMEKPTVTREQVTIALEEFARNFPNSDRTPEALFQLVRFRYDSEDFQGAVDDSLRMVALYPDNVMTGRVLLLQGQAQFKLRDVEGAAATFRNIVANYGGEADQASRLLAELQKRYGAGVGGGAAAPATETPRPATPAPATTAPKPATTAPKPATPAAPRPATPAAPRPATTPNR